MQNISKQDEFIQSVVDHLREGLNSILKGDSKAFEDIQLLRSLPSTVSHMFGKGKPAIAEIIINWLVSGLETETPEIRIEISRTLARIGDELLEKQRLDTIKRFSLRLLDWIRLETNITPAFIRICEQLGNFSQRLILDYRFTECEHILEVFNLIDNGLLRKEGRIREVIADRLSGIVTEDVVDLLLDTYHSDHQQREAALVCMTHLAAPLGEKLLDRLYRSDDMSERILILRTISDIGEPFIPPLTERLLSGGPWYYLRNLILLFGKFGSDTHLQILKPFLDHDDIRVQRETLNTIMNIGGKYREDIYLSLLENCSDNLKPVVIKNLGYIKSPKAVPIIIQILENSIAGTNDTDAEIIESACIALSHLGTPDAMPVLIEIIKQNKPGRFDEAVWDNIKTRAAEALMKTR